jgi:hypothetical protein
MIFWAVDGIRDFASLDESHKEDLGSIRTNEQENFIFPGGVKVRD